MGEVKTARVNNTQADAIEDMVDGGNADSESEAHRMFLDAGMAQYGYRAEGTNGDTKLKRLAAELARLFGYSGAAWVVFFWAFPIEVRIWGVVLLTMSLGMVGSYMVLMSVEPAISNRLFGRTEEDKA